MSNSSEPSHSRWPQLNSVLCGCAHRRPMDLHIRGCPPHAHQSRRGSGALGIGRPWLVVAMYVRGMGEPTPREAAYQLLKRQSRHRPTNPSGLIDLDTVDFAVERYAPGRCVLGATLKDKTGVDFCLLFFGLQESDGSWRARNARMRSIDRPGRGIDFLFEFAASPNAIDFVGFAIGPAAEMAASVSLTFSDGRMVTRPVDDGWVAYAADGDLASPIAIEITDAAGRVLLTDSYIDRCPGTPAGH